MVIAEDLAEAGETFAKKSKTSIVIAL